MMGDDVRRQDISGGKGGRCGMGGKGGNEYEDVARMMGVVNEMFDDDSSVDKDDVKLDVMDEDGDGGDD